MEDIAKNLSQKQKILQPELQYLQGGSCNIKEFAMKVFYPKMYTFLDFCAGTLRLSNLSFVLQAMCFPGFYTNTLLQRSSIHGKKSNPN